MAEGFIDGDLLEQFLDLPELQMTEICKGLKVRQFQVLLSHNYVMYSSLRDGHGSPVSK